MHAFLSTTNSTASGVPFLMYDPDGNLYTVKPNEVVYLLDALLDANTSYYVQIFPGPPSTSSTGPYLGLSVGQAGIDALWFTAGEGFPCYVGQPPYGVCTGNLNVIRCSAVIIPHPSFSYPQVGGTTQQSING
jgi:hypothetical protein